MKSSSFNFDPRVAVIELRDYADDLVANALDRAAESLGWSDEGRGPLSSAVTPGARVLIKPNWVMHENHGPWGIEPLVTHASFIRAAAEASLRAGASQVVVGDAPLQGCDFDQLIAVTGLEQWANDLMKREPRFKGLRDFRRTTCLFVDGVRIASENQAPEDQFVLFDLSRESLLEPITDESDSFRVTCYDPRLLAKTHAPGRHQYLVARAIIEADVVINLPKLKTHKKAGVTCALKNLIGINGNKEYLPHHRIGGSATGGDCYPGGSPIKLALEHTLDRKNMTTSMAAGRLWQTVATQLERASHLMGDRVGVEGSWPGNDTIWRTCLDLNRILLYGQTDASLAEAPQRRVIHLVDAVVAGQGDGPLAPEPLPLGLMLAGENAAAVDWVSAQLLGYDPQRIPIAREAFGEFRWPLVSFAHEAVELVGDAGVGLADALLQSREIGMDVNYPIAWRDSARNQGVRNGNGESANPTGMIRA
jgi:uncharacterized protein (DUF362 family)